MQFSDPEARSLTPGQGGCSSQNYQPDVGPSGTAAKGRNANRL